jgi:hypothetical protein
LLVGASVITGLAADLLLWEAAVDSEAVEGPAETPLLLAAAARRDIPAAVEAVAQMPPMVIRVVEGAQEVALGRLVFSVVAVVAALASLAKVLTVLAVSITGRTREA